MAKVFRQLYYHVVWTTKNREPVLTSRLQQHLFNAVTEKCRALGCVVHALNAIEDHVHLALEIPPALAVASAIGQIKGAASHHLNERQPGSAYWQDGYGVVTFRKGDLEKVKQYVVSQQERHAGNGLSRVLEAVEDEGRP